MTEETKGPDLTEVKFNDVRLSFADNLFNPEEGKIATAGKNKGKKAWTWSFNLLIPKDTDAGKAMIAKSAAAMKEALTKQFGDDVPKVKEDKRALRDGEGEKWDGYAGHYYVSCRTTRYTDPDAPAPKRPFKIIDAKRNAEGKFPELTASDERPYAGCYVSAIIRFFAGKDPEAGAAYISASIEAVQFRKHGKPFGGGPKVDVESAFDEADDEDGFDTGSTGSDDPLADLG